MLGDVHPGRSHAKIIAEIQELDDLTKAEIQRHRDCMTDLAKRKLAAKRRWNAQIPFTQLPEELIIYIFLLACSEGGRPLTPLRIGSICHNWRTIAWSAPELWSSVAVCLEVQQEAMEIQSDLLESWLRRAKKRPLSIVVTYRDEDIAEWPPPTADAKALHLVVAYSEQWRSIDLSIPEEWLECLDKLQGKFPLLERLTIEGAVRFNPEVFSVAPRLRSVAFKLFRYEWEELGKISLLWSQLTELSFKAEDIQTCLTVVERCSSLAHLALHQNLQPSFLPSLPPRTITINLDGVTSLHISPHGKDSLFMDSISAPHLKDVAVLSPWRTSDFLCSLCALITCSGCAKSITHLSFVGYIPSEKEMVEFLSKLHNLSQLELDNDERAPSFSNIFIDALRSYALASAHSGSSSQRLLPNLVSLLYVGPITLDSHAFLDMLDMRYNIGGAGDGPQLKSVAVHGYDESINEIGGLARAESLRAQGMKVDIGSKRRNFTGLYRDIKFA